MTEVAADSGLEVGSETGIETPATDTSTSTEHTPDVDQLLSELEKVADRIPSEKIRFLDKHFQPAFNRKLNLLQTSVESGVKTALGDKTFSLPEGKTALDLITENDGRGFVEALQNVVKAEFAPVKEKISQAEQQQSLGNAIVRAQNDHPEVKKYLNEAIKQIDQDQDLTALSMLGNGQGIYYVLQGVAANMAVRDRDAKIAELHGLLKQHNIAVKTASGTTKAGAQPPNQPAAPAKAKTIAEASKIALAKMKAERAEA